MALWQIQIDITNPSPSLRRGTATLRVKASPQTILKTATRDFDHDAGDSYIRETMLQIASGLIRNEAQERLGTSFTFEFDSDAVILSKLSV